MERQLADEYHDASGWQRVAVTLRAIVDVARTLPVQLAHELRQDLAFSYRLYRRRALPTTLGLIALTLAIGAATGVFSVLSALLLRQLPFRGAIVTHLDALDAAAEASAGVIRIIPRNTVIGLWNRVRLLLSLYRDHWSLDDMQARAAAVTRIQAQIPETGWLPRAFDHPERFYQAGAAAVGVAIEIGTESSSEEQWTSQLSTVAEPDGSVCTNRAMRSRVRSSGCLTHLQPARRGPLGAVDGEQRS